MKEEFDQKLNKLKDLKAKNRVKFKWQDVVIHIMEEMALPRTLASDKTKPPMDVTGVLMRHAKADVNVFLRRFALIKEKGLTGASAIKYYLGIVEGEHKE